MYLKDELAKNELLEKKSPISNDETKLEDEHHKEWYRHSIILQIGTHTPISLLGL